MGRPVTVEVERYRLPEQILNAGAGALYACGSRFTNLDVDRILADARRETGLTDWGGEEFIPLLRRLVELLESAHITPLARAFSRPVLVKAVRNRLRIREYVRKHPEVKDIPIEKPIFVVGFPRTGTTVMQNVLATHPDRRALQFWELTDPVPTWDDPVEDARRRIRATDRILSIAYRLAPEMGEVHEIRATTAEECWSLFANTFAVLNYEFQSGLTAYGDALMAQDMTWAYAEYREMLQVLLHQRPARQLVLKCPEHLWFLDSLLRVFPDACVLWTHRDPFDTIASYCSLISLNRRVYYGRFRPASIGPHIVERFRVGIERAMAVRDTADPARFLDLRFEDLAPDPAAAVRQVHAHFGLDHPADIDARVAAWLAEDRLDERGKHRYDAERYGLDRDAIHAAYARYIDHFQIPLRRGSPA